MGKKVSKEEKVSQEISQEISQENPLEQEKKKPKVLRRMGNPKKGRTNGNYIRHFPNTKSIWVKMEGDDFCNNMFDISWALLIKH